MNKKFRNQSFIDFLKNQGLPAVMWLMLFFGLILISGVVALDINHDRFPIGGIILLTAMIGVYLFLNGLLYAMYKQGNKVFDYEEFTSEDIIENVGVYIKNFDPLGMKKKFPPDLSKTIYEFDRADILLKENALFLLGKGETLIGKGFAAPVELVLFGEPVYPNHAKIISTQDLTDGRLELLIKDPNYNDNIKVVVENNEEIKLWLTRAKTHQGVL